MVVNKPAIIIYTDGPDDNLLKEICAGIEEEGVLYQVSNYGGDLDTLAFEAAKESMLGSGIGMKGKRAAMQMVRLPKGQNVFVVEAGAGAESVGAADLSASEAAAAQFRKLGANSARAIKKMPFKEMN